MEEFRIVGRGISVLELSQLVKALETRLGVTAQLRWQRRQPQPRPPRRLPPRRLSSRCSGQRRRPKDRRDQGDSRDYRFGPQGIQGPGRGRAQVVKEGISKEDAAKMKATLRGRATVEIK